MFNFDPHEIAANPVHLLYVLEQQIEQEQFPAEVRERYLRFIKEYLAPRYIEFIGKEIRPPTSSLTASTGRTSSIATCCTPTSGFRIRNTAIRRPAKSSTAWRSTKSWKDREASRHQQRRISATRSSTSCCARANNNGKNPSWLSYEKLRVVIEKKMFSNTEDLLPVISFNAKASKEDQKKHNDFVVRMVETRLYREAGSPALRVSICGCVNRSKRLEA